MPTPRRGVAERSAKLAVDAGGGSFSSAVDIDNSHRVMKHIFAGFGCQHMSAAQPLTTAKLLIHMTTFMQFA